MEKVKLELTKDEALVFFEFISRFTDADKLVIENKSEKLVLWAITAYLEKQLVEPLQSNYLEVLEKARKRIEKAY